MSGTKKSAPVKSKAAPAKQHSESEESSEEEESEYESSEEESSDESSEEESESEDERPVKKTVAKSAFAMLNDSDDDEESDDESEEESSESDDEPVKKQPVTKGKAAAAKPVQKKPVKQKGKKVDDDLDALLADIEAKPAAAKKAKPAAPKPATSVADGETPADGPPVLSKAAQKRLKQQQKAEADKKAAEEKAAKAALEPVKEEKKEEKKPAGPPKKESKAVLALKEQLRRQKEEEQRRIQEAEAQRLAEEEEERRLEEEEKKHKEEAERRKQERAEKREQLKKEGKLLSKAEKEKQLKAQQFIEQLKAQGLPIPEPKAEKKVKYGSKDKKDKKSKKEKTEGSADKQVEEVTEAVADVSISTPAPASRTKVSKGGKSAKVDKKAALAAAEAQRIRDSLAAETEAKRVAEELEAKRLAAEAAAAEAAALIAETEEVEEPEEPEDEMSESEVTVDDDEIEDSWAMDEDELQEAKELKLNEKKAAFREQKAARAAAREEKRAALLAKKEAAAKAAAELRAKAAAIAAEATKATKEAEAAAATHLESNDHSSPTNASSPTDANSKSSPDAKSSKKKDKETRELRSPICCILGHVDTGKTKLLDKIRQTNVQEGEAGGITQQIGATYFPAEAIRTKTAEISKMMTKELEIKVPGLLVIDTPGHESFTNLRSRGSGLCDIAVLVVDIMHGLEPQTLESIGLLKMRKTPFVVALNKIDRCYDWVANPNAPFRATLEKQKQHVRDEFEKRSDEALMALTEQGLNVSLYWKNPDVRSYVNVIPTSAVTGEGIPDLLMTLVRLTQSMMNERLSYISELQSTVLEVKMVEGLGTTIDVILVNGVLNEGDTIVVSGLNGPIVTTIRALLTPPHMSELRIKSEYVHHKSVKAAMGVKISAQGLEHAIAGSQLLVYKQGRGPSLEDLKDEVQADLATILSKVDKSGQGVCVQASTLGSLEALLTFLDEMKIPVMGINIGPVHKKDIMKASIMLERKPEYAVILAFDVKVVNDAEKLATELGVTIFTADIIYHLYDKVTQYMAKIKEERRAASAGVAVFPVVLDIMPNCVFNAKNPLVLGCRVVDGLARIGTPLCVPVRDKLFIGRITSMEKNHEQVTEGKKGDEMAIKIEMDKGGPNIIVGRQFEPTDQIVSKLSRESITVLKENFKDDLNQEEWKCVVKLKKVLDIM